MIEPGEWNDKAKCVLRLSGEYQKRAMLREAGRSAGKVLILHQLGMGTTWLNDPTWDDGPVSYHYTRADAAAARWLATIRIGVDHAQGADEAVEQVEELDSLKPMPTSTGKVRWKLRPAAVIATTEEEECCENGFFDDGHDCMKGGLSAVEPFKQMWPECWDEGIVGANAFREAMGLELYKDWQELWLDTKVDFDWAAKKLEPPWDEIQTRKVSDIVELYGTTITVDSTEGFKAGQEIQIDAERYKIEEIHADLRGMRITPLPEPWDPGVWVYTDTCSYYGEALHRYSGDLVCIHCTELPDSCWPETVGGGPTLCNHGERWGSHGHGCSCETGVMCYEEYRCQEDAKRPQRALLDYSKRTWDSYEKMVKEGYRRLR